MPENGRKNRVIRNTRKGWDSGQRSQYGTQTQVYEVTEIFFFGIDEVTEMEIGSWVPSHKKQKIPKKK